MKPVTIATALLSVLVLLPATRLAADDSKLKDATRQVESGAKATGQGIVETFKGVGSTVVEGAKVAGEKLKVAGKAAEPQARSAWQQAKDGAWSAGQSVKSFFARLVGK